MKFSPEKDGFLHERRIEFFHHKSFPGRIDSFALIHPRHAKKKNGLYVVFHSAGHDLYSCLGCTPFKNNHDIYRTPEDMFGLYLDCRAHEATDFWWGGINAKGEGDPKRKTEVQPVEKRVYATMEWVMRNYPVDANRVYACGNSMGGSGALGIAMCRGDLFAAVKVNVPAGVEHMIDRCFHSGLLIPDPPVCVDYSAQNDAWSDGHEKFFRIMRENKFALYAYWADFGHADNDGDMLPKNDLIHSFDWLSVRKDQAYPVFTNADADDPNPWENHDRSSVKAGQINAFFRWKNLRDRADSFAMELFLVTAKDLATSFRIPAHAVADVSLRRLQEFSVRKKQQFRWTFGEQNGFATADERGLLTIPRLGITASHEVLKLTGAGE